MNGPGGTDPIAAMASPSWPYQVVHVLLSCYQATAWAMVAIHAFILLRDPDADAAPQGAGAGAADRVPHRAGAAAVGRSFGEAPRGRAAAEARRGGGAPPHRRRARRCTSAAFPISRRASSTARLPIPGGLSFLAFGDFDATVTGLEAFPRADWPPVLRVRTAFQVMVGAGSAMALAALAVIVAAARRRRLARRAALAAGVRRAGPARLRQPRGRLAGDRVGAPAVDRPRADAHRRGGDGLSLQGGAVLAVHDRLPVPRRGRRLPAGAPDRRAPTDPTKAAGPAHGA